MIRIISKKEGFRRCGVAHSETPTDYDDDHFTEEELERLNKEPMLIVFEVPNPPEEAEVKDEAEAEDKAKTKKGK